MHNIPYPGSHIFVFIHIQLSFWTENPDLKENIPLNSLHHSHEHSYSDHVVSHYTCIMLASPARLDMWTPRSDRHFASIDLKRTDGQSNLQWSLRAKKLCFEFRHRTIHQLGWRSSSTIIANILGHLLLAGSSFYFRTLPSFKKRCMFSGVWEIR